MKTASYVFFSFFLIVIGIGLVRDSLFPPYLSNTLRLLQLIHRDEITSPLPIKKVSPSLKKLPRLPIVPFYTDIRRVLLGLLLCGLGFMLVYLFPTFTGRNHRDKLSISILNLFLGWSFLGWVIALIWAVTKDPIFLVESSANELTTQLKELDKLRKRGVLAELEFKKLKTKLLREHESMGGSSQNKNADTVRRICPHCAREYKIRAQLKGKMAVCRNCNKKFKL